MQELFRGHGVFLLEIGGEFACRNFHFLYCMQCVWFMRWKVVW